MKHVSLYPVQRILSLAAVLVCLFLAGNVQAQSTPTLQVRSLDGKYVIAHWMIEAKIAPTRFYIERSFDGQSYETIGIVDSDIAGNNDFHYSFLDDQPLSGTSYYRLRIAANNAEAVYSQAMNVLVDGLPTGYVPAQQLDPVLLSVSTKSVKMQAPQKP